MSRFSSFREQDPSEQSLGSQRFVIRAVQQQDLADLAQILADSFHWQSDFMRWMIPVMRIGIYEDLRNRLRTATSHYLCLAVVDTVRSRRNEEYLVGTVEVALRSTNPWQPRSPQYAYLSNLAVRSDSRRQGVARRLLEACEHTVLEWGYQDLFLHVLENNQQARQLYLRQGYQLEATDGGWSCLLFGKPRRLFLRKRLTAIPKNYVQGGGNY